MVSRDHQPGLSANKLILVAELSGKQRGKYRTAGVLCCGEPVVVPGNNRERVGSIIIPAVTPTSFETHPRHSLLNGHHSKRNP